MTNKYKIQLRDREPFCFNADSYSVGNSFTRFRLGKEFKANSPLLTINNLDIVSIQWVETWTEVQRELTIKQGVETVNVTLTRDRLPNDFLARMYQPSRGVNAPSWRQGYE